MDLGAFMRCYGGLPEVASAAAATEGWRLFLQGLASSGTRKAGRV